MSMSKPNPTEILLLITLEVETTFSAQIIV